MQTVFFACFTTIFKVRRSDSPLFRNALCGRRGGPSGVPGARKGPLANMWARRAHTNSIPRGPRLRGPARYAIYVWQQCRSNSGVLEKVFTNSVAPEKVQPFEACITSTFPFESYANRFFACFTSTFCQLYDGYYPIMQAQDHPQFQPEPKNFTTMVRVTSQR